MSGYIPAGNKDTSKFDFGPMNTTISGNTIEGARFRFGGMTTAHLNKNWFAQGYVAYGVKDKKLKFVWALSLPGKVAPTTSAEFIKDTIYNIVKEIYK